VEGDRDWAGYTLGYNHSPLQRRAHDVLTLLSFIKNHERKPTAIEVRAAKGDVPEFALALTQAGAGVVQKAVLPETDFRFAALTNFRAPQLLPGALKYGDLPAMLARVKAGK
jgi:hypothetical protein